MFIIIEKNPQLNLPLSFQSMVYPCMFFQTNVHFSILKMHNFQDICCFKKSRII